MTQKDKSLKKAVPFKLRLRAWWEGYDVEDIANRLNTTAPQSPETNTGKSAPEATRRDDSQRILWDEARVKIAQLVWGQGFCGPGGAENVIAMSKLLALTPKMSALVLGAGLGGPARVLAQEFGVWITGYESNDILAKEGMKMSVGAGLEKKAPILQCDLNDKPSFDRNFERAFCKEALFTVENKKPLIQSVYKQLKDDSLFLISDYVIKSPESMTNPDVLDWLRHEPLDPFPVTSEMQVKLLEEAGFTIRVNEDTTEHYLEMVNEAWETATGAVEALATEEEEEARSNMNAVLQEAELWNRRTKIMRSGELKVCRYLAHKAATIK
ncbi:hypothetical protein [Paremcibacter congregatus]|uniref:hypothetical protein n=1 Tax=Paremcibacter congregatus TaxID=2043170 RepID=UPI0030EDCFEB|tara:strand:+ start:1824 stop:2801 length:978 start_codon:yes stop_codon:yes gene_type:complete